MWFERDWVNFKQSMPQQGSMQSVQQAYPSQNSNILVFSWSKSEVSETDPQAGAQSDTVNSTQPLVGRQLEYDAH